MYRYVALVWNPDDPDARLDARAMHSRLSAEWVDGREVFSEAGCAAFISSAHFSSWQTVAQPGNGIIFGRLFRAGRETESGAPRIEEWERIRATRGKSLIESWWGRYVAITCSASGTESSVLRDPSSGLPCFIARHRRGWLIFSDIEVCRKLLSLSVNWQYVSEFLKGGNSLTSQTGLIEVTEVQPGECITLSSRGMQRVTLWNPVEAAIADPIESPASAIAALKETVERCVNAWASLHRSVVHMLSGGLDSSIVLSCLARAPSKPRVACLHIVSSVEHELEQRYAQLAAEHAGSELRELQIEVRADLAASMARLRPAARPLSTIYEALTAGACASFAVEKGATAVTSGVAGDSLFFQPAAEFAATDHIRRRGLRASALRVAWNAALVSGECFWPTLWRGILQRSPEYSLMSVSLADRRAPPGLSTQLASLSVAPPFYDAFELRGAQELERCPVLLSQPLIELCLRIPSDVWIAAGCDRALIRQAFASELPDAIVRRTAKGSANACYGQLFESNADFIRQELLGGTLAEEGCIDAKWLVSQLSGARLRGLEHDRILHRYLCAEFWVRHWNKSTICAPDIAGSARSLDWRTTVS